MTLQVAMMAAQAIPSVIQGVTGVVQTIKGNKLAKGIKDPEYVIPTEATQALQLAKTNAASRKMAGQQFAQEAIDQNYAGGASDVVSAAGSSSQALSGLLSLDRTRSNAQNELGFNAARDFEQRQNVLRNELGTYAGYRDKAFDINVMQKFLRDSATASAMKNAGMRNTYEGIKGLAGAGVQKFGYDAQKDAIDNLQGTTKSTGALTGGGYSPAPLRNTTLGFNIFNPPPTTDMGFNYGDIQQDIIRGE